MQNNYDCVEQRPLVTVLLLVIAASMIIFHVAGSTRNSEIM